MATLHSDFLLGNDTTGNGSAALPYKTIVKSLQMAADDDLVKVAGGEFVTTGATGTCTARSTSMTTSIDLTSQLAVGDVIALDTSLVDGFPIFANVYQVASITSTTIQFRTIVSHVAGTFTIYKFSTVHYATTGSANLENATGITANRVTVEGGWNSTFTTQIGWTVANRNATSFSTTAGLMSWSNLIKPEIVFNRFLCVGINMFNGSAASVGINEVAFSTSSSSGGAFGTSNFGIYAPTSVGYTTIYSNGFNINNTWNGAGNRPTTLQLKQWLSPQSLDGIKVGVALNEGVLAGPSIKTLEAHFRSCGNNVNVSTQNVISGTSVGDVYIDELNLYLGGQQVTPLFGSLGTTTGWRWIGDVRVFFTDSTRSGITAFRNSINTSGIGLVAPWNVNLVSYEFEQLPWLSYGSSPGSRAVANAQSAMIYGRDSSGNQKVVDSEGIVRWADTVEYVTGVNSLRTKLLTNTVGVDTIRYYVGHFAKPSTTFTVTIKMKASKTITLGNNSSKLELQYGPSFATYVDVTPSTTTLGTTWTDVTFTLDPSTLSMWNTADDGLVQVIIPILSSQITDQNEVAYLWIDSITVA